MRFLETLKELIYPRRCAFCGRKATDGFTVCKTCLSSLPRSYEKPIFPVFFKKGSRFYLKCVMSPFFYSGPVRSAVRALKFQGRTSAATPLAAFMSDILFSSYYYRDIDCIMSVPISKKRLKQRTYNQSDLLAAELSKLTDIPFDSDNLIRHGHRPPQSSISSKAKRLQNVKGVFSVTYPDKIRGKRILLVDDVITTGSTLNECAKVLTEAGAAEVLAVTAAQACR